MKIIEPSFEILRPRDKEEGINQLRFIEQMARISHRSEDLQTDQSWERFIKFVVMTKGDWSVVEHASATVRFRVDRGVTHELVRHRLFSFTQESTRFVNYNKKEMEFLAPSFPPAVDDPVKRERYLFEWQGAIGDAENAYTNLVKDGLSPQIARSVLPNALAATIAVTGNLRNWRHLLIMRTTQETHPDFKRVMIPLLQAMQNRVPLLFDDIVPGQKQSEALSKPR
jgi:thymidylate synthase (FAD)